VFVVFFVFYKKTPLVLPQTKVKSCRAYVFASSIFSINKKSSFLSRHLLFYVVYFILVLFLEKMVIQKTQKILFSFPFKKNKFQKSAFTYLTKITHKSYAD